MAPLAYMLVRTLNNAFIILDEAQNSTMEQMFMFLTRLGLHSKAVITGDETQIDLPPHKQSGLVEAHRALRRGRRVWRSWSSTRARRVVRHPLVQRIIAAYEEHRGEGGMSGDVRVISRRRGRAVDTHLLRRMARSLLEETMGLQEFDLVMRLVGARAMAGIEPSFHLNHEGADGCHHAGLRRERAGGQPGREEIIIVRSGNVAVEQAPGGSG